MTKIEDADVVDAGVIHLRITDHSLAYICHKVSIPKTNPEIIETRQFKTFSSTMFESDLRGAFCNQSNFYNNTDPNQAWETRKNIFLEIANEHFPLRL